MTTYAFDTATRRILAVWPTGIGSRADTAVALPDPVPPDTGQRLAVALSHLSDSLWDVYLHSPSTVPDTPDAAQERWRREHRRDAFDTVTTALRAPNLPDQTGAVCVSYNPVEESAHQLGRLLHTIDEPEVTDAVATETRREIDAVRAAELGTLTGRAAQAITLDRIDASPAQIAAANDLLDHDPLATEALLTTVEPAAACIAAAHWLTAAAKTAAENGPYQPWDVFAESDKIQPCSVVLPSQVVYAVAHDHHTPRDVVTVLLRHAALVRQGRVPDPDSIATQVTTARQYAESLPPHQRPEVLAALLPPRSTHLDPLRPTRDLLEHLLDGIASSARLFHEIRTDDQLTEDALNPPELNDSTPYGDAEIRDEFIGDVQCHAQDTAGHLT